MKKFHKRLISSCGFSLIELIVVLVIAAILAQIGFIAFNRFTRRSRAFAAKTSLINLKSECESNRELGLNTTFTLLPVMGYSIATRNENSCLGQVIDDKVAALSDNPLSTPNYFYDFDKGEISCNYNNLSDNLFKNCNDLKSDLENKNFVVKDSYLERGCSAYAVVEGRTWDQAEANSQKLGGHLVTVNNKDENNWLTSNLKWLEPPNTNYGAYGWNDGSSGYYPNGFKNVGGGKIISYWIGLKEKDELKGLANQGEKSPEEQRNNVVWADGTPVEYINQGRTDGGNGVNEDYFVLNNRGYFNDIEDPSKPTYSSDWQQVNYGIVEIPKC